MESSAIPQTPDDPRSQLVEVDRARQRLAARMRLPPGLHPALATSVAVQLATAAYGIASQTTAGLAVALAGVAVCLGVAAVTLYQFRRINGVRVDGLASQIVLGTGSMSTVIYVGAFAVATWAAFASRWWLVISAALLGGVGYAFGVLRWWHAYQRDPAAHTSGATPRVLAALAVLAFLGLVALVIGS